MEKPQNPYGSNPFYNPSGQQLVDDIITGRASKKTSESPNEGVEVNTQDVKPQEVTKDEPKKRGRKARKSTTESQPTEGNTSGDA